MHKVYEMDLGGKKLVVETGKYAEQANGSCIIRCGDTALIVAAAASEKPREGMDFFPLSIEFEEKQYSVGKIPGGFIKREGRPTEKSILTARMIDRPIRPLFPKGYYNDVQIIATVLSVDTDIPPETYAMIGSSIVLSISDIPFAGPTGSVIVGFVDGEYVLNPNTEQTQKSLLHLVVSGTKDAVMMVECGAKEVSEDQMLEAILFGHEYIKQIVEFQEKIVAEIGLEKLVPVLKTIDPELNEKVREVATEKLRWSLDTFDRDERQDRSALVEAEVWAMFEGEYPEYKEQVGKIIYNITKELVREKILGGVRPDGRKQDEIRPIWSEVGILRRPHGSAVFTRGQTQVMTIATLGAMGDVQKLDGLGIEDSKRYMHHYNMLPYSVGEAKPRRGPNRREIGHGALAERALEPMIPSEEDFPYAIRLVSEVISSNGSTSMASVCGSTLSLMDAGVPIIAPVAGIAMGLIKNPDSDTVAILTDIQGLEDFLGDMDFKVAGTEKGITAIQMDIKIKGIDRNILQRALEQARIGRLHILGKMAETLSEPRANLSEFAPKIIRFTIDPDKIREVIGPGGKMINKIISETGVKIDIEDDGRVFLATADEAAAQKAKNMIESIVRVIKVGDIFLGKVVRIMPFGAIVEFAPGKDGMVHISKLANERVEKVEDVVSLGDEIMVKVVEMDKMGKISLSRKDLLPSPVKAEN